MLIEEAIPGTMLSELTLQGRDVEATYTRLESGARHFSCGAEHTNSWC